jgi:hypothetical protein
LRHAEFEQVTVLVCGVAEFVHNTGFQRKRAFAHDANGVNYNASFEPGNLVHQLHRRPQLGTASGDMKQTNRLYTLRSDIYKYDSEHSVVDALLKSTAWRVLSRAEVHVIVL